VDERSIRTIDAFHVEAHVKLLLGRIDRALDIQTELVKNDGVLEVVISDVGWPLAARREKSWK